MNHTYTIMELRGDIDFSAKLLISSLEKANIFPPSLSDPSSYLPESPLKRSPNAFFICKKNVFSEAKKRRGKLNVPVATKAASILWKQATFEEKKIYQDLANAVLFLNNKRKDGCNASFGESQSLQQSVVSNSAPNSDYGSYYLLNSNYPEIMNYGYYTVYHSYYLL